MKTVFSLILAAMLAGCAGFDTVKLAAASKGAQAADEVQQTAEWTLCNGISVGAWRRAYGSDAGRAQGWAALCTQPAGVPGK